MAQSSLYPPEHMTRRVLELACPTADLDLRENCAFLVAQRRLTIDEAIEYANSEAAKDAAKAAAAATTRRGTQRTTSSASANPSANTAAAAATASRSYLPPPPPRQRVPATNADAATPTGQRKSSSSGSNGAVRSGGLPALVQSTEAHQTTAAAASRHGGPNSGSRRSRSDSELADAESASTPALPHDAARQSSSAPLVTGAPGDETGGDGGTAKRVVLPERRSTRRVAVDARAKPPPITAPAPARLDVEAPAPAAADDAEVAGDAEPLLSALKQATPEERAAFEEKQADMLYYEYGEETSMFDSSLARFGPGQVLFFTTSMTGERAVRDRCRQMENLLFLKLIPHHTMDVADSAFFLQRLRRLYASNTGKQTTPSPPMLFVDKKLIGDFPTLQELEDCGELDAKLLESGCRVLRKRVVEAYGRRKAGLAAEPLVLPKSPARAAEASSAERSPTTPARVAAASSPPVATPRATASTAANAAPSAVAAGAVRQRAPPSETREATARRVSQGQGDEGEEGEPQAQGELAPRRMLPPPPPIPRTNPGLPPPASSPSPSATAAATAAQQQTPQSPASARAAAPHLPALAPHSPPPASGTPPARNGYRRQPPPVYTVAPA